jgi:hypothetical protein
MTAPPVALKESIDIPWDDEDSLDESVEAALGKDEASTNEFEASTIHPAGTYSESTNDSALRFGICFTTEQYHETKLCQQCQRPTLSLQRGDELGKRRSS